MKINKLIYGIAFVLIGFLIMSCGRAEKLPEADNLGSKVKIAYLPVIQSLPLYLAIEKGYFNEAGINVELIKFESPNLLIDSLLLGKADVGMAAAAGITAISNFRKPDYLKVFALIGSNETTTNNDLLIIRKDSEIKTIQDLKGKKLGILPGIQFRTLAKHLLLVNNLSEVDVTVIDLAPTIQVQALASKQVDALLTIEPTGIIAQSKGISKELLHSPMTKFVSNPWYGGAGIIRANFLQENPELSKQVIDVFDRAISEINRDPETTEKYLLNYMPLTEDLLESSDLVSLTIWKNYRDFNLEDINAYQKFIDLFYNYGVIEGRVYAKDLIYA